MVKLEGTIRRYLGLSTDDKPQSGVDDKIPPGSSFLETDTGRIYRYNGEAWRYAEPSDDTAALLAAILLELREVRTAVALATA